MSEHLPRKVADALAAGDQEALSRMGRKGAERAALNRALEKARKEGDEREAALVQARLLSLSPEGDVLPPDPETIAFLENDEKERQG